MLSTGMNDFIDQQSICLVSAVCHDILIVTETVLIVLNECKL